MRTKEGNLPIQMLLLLLMSSIATAYHKIPWWNIQVAQNQGPNVCVVEEIPEIGQQIHTECKYWRPRTICGRQAVTKYDCCEGYGMVRGQSGCTRVNPLTDLIETAKRIGARKFAALLETSDFAAELRSGSTLTLFAPTDKSFERYIDLHGIRPERLNGVKYGNLARYHLLDSKIPSSKWRADSLLETKLPGYKLRVNKYSNGMETVNCELIIRKNQQATNGVVHLIDGVLEPSSYEDRDLTEVLAGDTRFSVFASLMNNSNFINRIRNNRHVSHTIFAPSDEVFQQMSKARLQKILNHNETAEALLAHHVVANPICLPGVVSEHRMKTLGPETLSIDCDSRGVTLEKRRVRQEFIQGINGLVYLIDYILLPDKAKTVIELADDRNLSSFANFIRGAGLEEAFVNFEPYTLFVPSEMAMRSLPESELELMKGDRDLAAAFIMNHAVHGKHTSDSIYDGQVVTSLDEKTPLRLQVYRGGIGIEDAIVEQTDIEGSNGVLHVVNKIIRPNMHPLDELLRNDGNFSIWLKAMDKMREIQPDTFEEFKRTERSYTYFVPSDDAFKNLGQVRLDELLENSTYLSETLRNHVAETMMASGGFKSHLRYTVQTKQNTVDVVKRNEKMTVNDARLTKRDMLNRNGVAHQIDKVLLPNKRSDLQRKRGIRRARRHRF